MFCGALLLAALPAAAQWTGKGEAGLAIASGNSDSRTANARVSATRKLGAWEHKLGLAGLYVRSEGDTTAKRWEASGQTRFDFRPDTFWYGGGRYEEDRFSGFLVYDDSDDDRRPGLVMVPNWMGVTADALERARAIAGDDYVVLVADVYGKGRQPKDSDEAGRLAGSLRGDDRGPLRARMQAAVETLRAQAGNAPLDAARIGALGFCFGGSAALELARSGADLAGVVSLHGGLAAGAQSATAQRILAPVLVLNGADDTAVDDAQVLAFEQEMDAAGADWQFVDFSGAVHCFAEPSAGSDPASNCRYDERASRRAYRMMDGFFDEVFGHGLFVEKRPPRREAGEEEGDRDDAEQGEDRLQKTGEEIAQRFHQGVSSGVGFLESAGFATCRSMCL